MKFAFVASHDWGVVTAKNTENAELFTGVAEKHPVFHLTLCAGTDANHFGDINEMVGEKVSISL
jgi:hypothetical protein